MVIVTGQNTDGARNLDQFLCVKGPTYVSSNPKSIPEAVG
jgi:hypothetical protein